MLNFLRDAAGKQDKKLLAKLVCILAAGLALIVCGNTLFKEDALSNGQEQANVQVGQPVTDSEVVPVAAMPDTVSYEQQLENRLKSIYEAVEGAGKVSVMVTLAYGREIVVAEDSVTQQSVTAEKDGQGVSREQQNTNAQGTKIIINGQNGQSQPLVLKELEPKVEGVIIVAQGGDNIYIAEALIRATQTVLGIEPHKVQVLKMKA